MPCAIATITLLGFEQRSAVSAPKRRDFIFMTTTLPIETEKYASCIEASKRVRWAIEADVIRGRDFDMTHKLLPDSISGIRRFEFLDEQEARILSQIQGRTYANMFGLVERFINCKVLELSQHLCTGDQVALEALIRFSDEELKHQELFRRIEKMIAAKMPRATSFCHSRTMWRAWCYRNPPGLFWD
jgi:hypothetical protein